MKILSCGAGMQSTALALMSCENALNKIKYPEVPIYDAIIFCDLGKEPIWVYQQVRFIRRACEMANILFIVLKADLYADYLNHFGISRTTAIPFWSTDENGRKGRMRRHCTIDYKIVKINNYVRWNLLGYKKGQWTKAYDVKAHEMHIGFSKEEQRRIFDSQNKLFVNKFPLIEMGMERKDNYAYVKEVWGLETKASACVFCPFHTNYFFEYLKEYEPDEYRNVVAFDDLIGRMQPSTGIKSSIYISKSRKRIRDLLPEECQDRQCFEYMGMDVWNGF